ncbi:MAG: glutamine synthetase family protein [Candidatus Methanodesulfokora sp.]
MQELKKVKRCIVSFSDIQGKLRSFVISGDLIEDLVTSGIDVDGSSVGITDIERSDIVLKGDESTFRLVNLDGREMGFIMAEIADQADLDPRYILRRKLSEIAKMDMRFMVGAEVEFFLLKGDRPADESIYFDSVDDMMSTRLMLSEELERMGLKVELMHHEVAPGQNEINFRFDDAVRTADNILVYKMAVKKAARTIGLRATFMPKPFEGVNGSGMHIHMSLFSGGRNLFYHDSDISDYAKWFIGGILAHAKGLSFFASPTINSYKRIVPGFEAPVYISWGYKNRSALVRIPSYNGQNSCRIEYRAPDPTSNPYLLFSVVLAAGLDGIRRRIDPGEPRGDNLYHSRDADTLPGSLEEAMKHAMEDDVLIEAVGRRLFARYVELKKAEITESRKHVSEWERKFYIDF